MEMFYFTCNLHSTSSARDFHDDSDIYFRYFRFDYAWVTFFADWWFCRDFGPFLGNMKKRVGR